MIVNHSWKWKVSITVTALYETKETLIFVSQHFAYQKHLFSISVQTIYTIQKLASFGLEIILLYRNGTLNGANINSRIQFKHWYTISMHVDVASKFRVICNWQITVIMEQLMKNGVISSWIFMTYEARYKFAGFLCVPTNCTQR